MLRSCILKLKKRQGGLTVRILPVLLGVSLGLVAAPASAATMLPNPASFNFTGLGGGEITLVSDTTGLPLGGLLFGGSVGGSDAVLLFTAEILSGAEVKSITVELIGFASTGAGWIDDPGVLLDWKQATAVGDGWEFKPDGAKLKVGSGESDLFFASFASLPSFGTLEFSIEYMDGTESFTTVFFPEPSSALLLGLGLLGLGLAARARRAP